MIIDQKKNTHTYTHITVHNKRKLKAWTNDDAKMKTT